jgi:anaerobic magnesium-protoporphyrin IX monomethyl ester cyclase
MSKILFISNQLWYESLSIMQLSAVVKQGGHESFLYLDNGNYEGLIRFVNKIKPDLIGFSVMTGQHFWAIKTAEILKEKLNKNKPLIIFGGPHPTFVPEIIENRPIDIICRGEGEGAILSLMNSIENKSDFSNISNLWVKKDGVIIKNELTPLIDDLDSLPFLDREIFYQHSYFRDSPNKMIMASRGCPFSCAFCFNEKYRQLYKIKPTYIRRRSCSNVIEEIKLLKTRYKHTRIIKFQDDIFTLDKQWLYKFLAMFKKEIKLQFVCLVRAGMIDEETIRKLAEAGCRCVMFGVETGNEELRNYILKKQLTDQQLCDTSKLLKKYKIKIYVSNILFIPGATIEDSWKTVKINQKIKPDYSVLTIFQPYPGTALNETLKENSQLASDYLDKIKNFDSPPAVVSKQKNEEKNIYYFFYILVRFPRLMPFMRLLIKCKPNILFLLVFKMMAGIEYRSLYRLSLFRFFQVAYYNFHDFKKRI